MSDSSMGSNKHLRIGGQDQVMTYNRESDDAVLPDLSSQGESNPLHFRQIEGADQTLRYRNFNSAPHWVFSLS